MPPQLPIELKAFFSSARQHEALRDGTVTIPGVRLEHVAMPYATAFHVMGHTLEFDVCEFSYVSYLTAREHGLPLSAIPVIPQRVLPHRTILKNVHAGVEEPRDLEGKKVGVRTYTVTPGVVARGMLSDEFSVDLSSITWVLAEPEHVPQAETRYPPNVVKGDNEDLFPRLVSGELAGGLPGVNLKGARSPHVAPLFSNAEDLDRAQYECDGFVPVFSIVAIKDVVLEKFPWIAEALYEALQIARGGTEGPDPYVNSIVGEIQFPNGLSANRKALEHVLRLAHEQGIVSDSLAIDDLFIALD